MCQSDCASSHGWLPTSHTSYAESMFCSFKHQFSASLQDSLEEHSSKWAHWPRFSCGIIHGHFEITVLLHIVCHVCTLLVWCGINHEKGVECKCVAWLQLLYFSRFGQRSFDDVQLKLLTMNIQLMVNFQASWGSFSLLGWPP